jgi:hypothetical protein
VWQSSATYACVSTLGDRRDSVVEANRFLVGGLNTSARFETIIPDPRALLIDPLPPVSISAEILNEEDAR